MEQTEQRRRDVKTGASACGWLVREALVDGDRLSRSSGHGTGRVRAAPGLCSIVLSSLVGVFGQTGRRAEYCPA